MDSEQPTMRRQQISDETLRKMSGTDRRNGWSLGGAVAAATIAGLGLAFIAIKWILP